MSFLDFGRTRLFQGHSMPGRSLPVTPPTSASFCLSDCVLGSLIRIAPLPCFATMIAANAHAKMFCERRCRHVIEE